MPAAQNSRTVHSKVLGASGVRGSRAILLHPPYSDTTSGLQVAENWVFAMGVAGEVTRRRPYTFSRHEICVFGFVAGIMPCMEAPRETDAQVLRGTRRPESLVIFHRLIITREGLPLMFSVEPMELAQTSADIRIC